MADLAVSCSGLVKVYEAERGKVQALRGVDMAARIGSVTAIVGPSGSGKTSLLRQLAAVDSPTAGEVVIAGTPLSMLGGRARRRLRRRHIGYVQQRPSDNLISHTPLTDFISAVARHRGVPAAEARSLQATLGLGDRSRHEPHQLSGGEQQRAAIAAALVGGPALLLADEPTAELDLGTTRLVCELLHHVADTRGVAVVVATHDPEVMQAAQHVLLLRDGAVQSETVAGRERGVIDSTGRVQLPPEVLAWFPDRRVSLELDPATNTIRISPQ